MYSYEMSATHSEECSSNRYMPQFLISDATIDEDQEYKFRIDITVDTDDHSATIAVPDDDHILLNMDTEPEPDWFRTSITSGAWDDWFSPEEDVYTEDDGQPL